MKDKLEDLLIDGLSFVFALFVFPGKLIENVRSFNLHSIIASWALAQLDGIILVIRLFVWFAGKKED